jgi:hypothetical protein
MAEEFFDILDTVPDRLRGAAKALREDESESARLAIAALLDSTASGLDLRAELVKKDLVPR